MRNKQLVTGKISIQISECDIHFVLCVPIESKDFDIENNVKLVNDIFVNVSVDLPLINTMIHS
jgi:hypothetical protein